MKKLLFYTVLITLVSFANIQCSLFKSAVIENIKVKQIKSVKISKLPIPILSDEAEFTFLLGVQNDNPIDITVKKTEFEVYINKVKLGKGISEQSQILAKNNISDLQIKFSFKAGEIAVNGLKFSDILASKEPLEFELKGDLTTLSSDKEYKVPFSVISPERIEF